ncbi:MAG: hypothetical protein V7727_01970 [Sneathiella sp.]
MKQIYGPLLGAIVALLIIFPAAAEEDDGIHRLVLQVSDNDPEKMTSALNVAANVSRHYSAIGEEVEIKILAFNAGINMLIDGTSPVQKRLSSFRPSMPNVSFLACGNTINSLARKHGTKPELLDDVEVVQAGVVTLMELDKAGWTIVRP